MSEYIAIKEKREALVRAFEQMIIADEEFTRSSYGDSTQEERDAAGRKYKMADKAFWDTYADYGTPLNIAPRY